MKYSNKEELREKAIKLYLDGKTMKEISKLVNCSRNFIGNLIREDKRIKEYRKRKIVKLYKWKNQCRINVPISVEFWEKIGISRNCNTDESVEITVDENNKTITIKKV